MLRKLLGCHSSVRCAHEPFNSDTPLGKKYAPTTRDQKSLDFALHRVWKVYNGIKHVWDYCLGWPFAGLCPNQPLNQHLLIASRAKVILLARRNVLRRLVSNEVSLQTKRWDPDDVRRRVIRRKLKPLDIEWVKWQLERERAAIYEHRKRLIDARRPFLDVWYEDLFAEDLTPQESLLQLKEIISFIELPQLGRTASWSALTLLDQRTQPITSRQIYSRIPNVNQIERRLGSDYTGWLFK